MKKKHSWGILAAALCFALALFFGFALIGYRIMALMMVGIGLCILLYLYLPKKFRIMLTVLLCVGVIVLGIAEIPVIRASKGEPERNAPYLIVLGCGINGSAPSLSMLNRLTAAKAYLEAHPDSIAVVSGGQGPGEDITEAEAMRRWLSAHGISDDRIVSEERSTSTEENLEYSFAMLPPDFRGPVALCSSEYHLYRAGSIARQMGYEAFGVPGRTSYPVLRLNYFIREGLGVIYMQIFG